MASAAAIEGDSSSKGGILGAKRMIPLQSKGSALWAVKGMFHLGEGQKDGLTYDGLRARLLSTLETKPWVFDPKDPRQESTAA